jgi:3',5'-cyclic-AMP phosphodiesterase
MTGPTRALALSALVCSATGCLTVADERAQRDETIGRAQVGGVSVRVDEGLAAVRSLSAQELRLWAQAPAFSLTVETPGDGGPLAITVENALSDAVLSRDDGSPLPLAAPEPDGRPTVRRWQLDTTELGPIQLRLAPPDVEARTPFRFAVYADVQERIEDVQDIYRRMSQDASIRYALVSGDLTDFGSAEQLARFQEELRTLAFPVYCTLGNHELGTPGTPFHDWFGRGSFSFAFRGARFTLLDSGSATLAPVVYRWLDGWLAAGADGFHVVATHIPPLDPVGTRNGAFASRLEASRLLGLLAAGGVDLTVYGHVHSYYAFVNAGIPAFISGGGGGIPERLDGIARHYLTVDIDPASQRSQVAVVRID